MTEHLPECRWPQYAKALLWGSVSRSNRERVSCICKELLACEVRVAHEERARIVAGINAWCDDDPVISRADPNDVWHYASGVRFTRQRIERGDFSE